MVCFALPLYMLFWGVLSFPLWIGVVRRGGEYAWWHLFDTVAGCMGTIGLFGLLRFYMSDRADKRFRGKTFVFLGLLGLAAVWGGVTDHFSIFELNAFVLLSAVLPTVCTAHLFALAFRHARSQTPNNALQATCEDARA